MSTLRRATSYQVLPEYSIPLKPDNYLMIMREPPVYASLDFSTPFNLTLIGLCTGL